MTKKTILGLTFAAELAIGVGYAGFQAMASPDVKLTYYTVEKGDTVWDVAKKYRPKSEDIRQTVYDICQTNKLNKNAGLTPGQRLLIKDGRATK